MALTSGFFNALNHDRQYEAVQVGSIFDGIIRDGIFATEGQALAVTASGTGLIVNVGTGRAWFDHTWTLNDAILPIEADEAEIVLDRIDALVLEVDASLSGRTNSIKFVKGTPSSTPVKPTLINTEEIHQYALAYVSIKAEQTLIEQQDIENAIGTEATPFVTGILETVDVTMLIAQWQAQFEAMIRDDQQDFTNWEILTKAAYEAWFAGVQAEMEEDMEEFEGWEEATKTEFDSWFQNLQDELDENQAAHLQRQIGNLNALETSAKSDLVSAINEVNGRITTSVSEILIDYDENMVGVEITLSHTESAEGHTPESYTRTLVEPEPGRSYEIEVDVKNLGEWVISWTHEGYSYTETLDVHYYGYYHVVLHEGFTWREWVVTGGISILKHDSLASLLADEEDVRRLFLVHNAVDYMVEKGNNRSECTTIINNDLCAKWINLSDYALDKLYTNTSLKSLMDTADKYFYGEWIYDGTSWGPKGNVPVMTSNSAPYGTAGGNGGSSNPNYYAFDGNDNTYYSSIINGTSGQLIGYVFPNPVNVKRIYYKGDSAGEVKVKYSDDGGTTWNYAGSTYEINVGENVLDISDNGYHLEWVVEGASFSSATRMATYTLQFYGRELKVSVPTMTSNTAPYGVASSSSVYQSGYEAYKAFDGNNSTYAASVLGNSFTLTYKFTKKVIIQMVEMNVQSFGQNVKVYGSLTGESSDWVELDTINEGVEVIDNDNEYIYYQVALTGTSTTFNVRTLQFYGKDYSEKEFANDGAKWLYDHGLELEVFVYNTVGSGSVSKSENGEIYVEVPAATQRATSALVNVNLANYSLLRAVAGSRFYEKPQLSITQSPAPSYSGATFDSYYVLDPPIDKNNLSLSAVSINADRYVGIYCGNNTGSRNNIGTISELWLE